MRCGEVQRAARARACERGCVARLAARLRRENACLPFGPAHAAQGPDAGACVVFFFLFLACQSDVRSATQDRTGACNQHQHKHNNTHDNKGVRAAAPARQALARRRAQRGDAAAALPLRTRRARPHSHLRGRARPAADRRGDGRHADGARRRRIRRPDAPGQGFFVFFVLGVLCARN